MRKFIFPLLFSLMAFPALAAEKHSVSYGGPSSHTPMAIGFADTTNMAATQSASALFGTAGGDWIQVLASMGKTKGDVDFALGGFYKLTLAGDRHTGFHASPGFTIGTVGGSFAFAVMAGAGAHYTIQEHLILSVDGGPMFTHTRDNNNFRILPMGDLIGASVHYLF